MSGITGFNPGYYPSSQTSHTSGHSHSASCYHCSAQASAPLFGGTVHDLGSGKQTGGAQPTDQADIKAEEKTAAQDISQSLKEAESGFKAFLNEVYDTVIAPVVKFFQSIGDAISAFCAKLFGSKPFEAAPLTETTQQRFAAIEGAITRIQSPPMCEELIQATDILGIRPLSDYDPTVLIDDQDRPMIVAAEMSAAKARHKNQEALRGQHQTAEPTDADFYHALLSKYDPVFHPARYEPFQTERLYWQHSPYSAVGYFNEVVEGAYQSARKAAMRSSDQKRLAEIQAAYELIQDYYSIPLMKSLQDQLTGVGSDDKAA